MTKEKRMTEYSRPSQTPLDVVMAWIDADQAIPLEFLAEGELLESARRIAHRLAVEQHALEEGLSDSAAEVSNPALPTIAGFEADRYVGAGSMGQVFHAWQESPRREVAIKIVHAASSIPHLQNRLKREAETLAQLNHPGVACPYSVGLSTDGRFYLSMEWIGGDSITDYCRSNAIDIIDRVRFLVQFLDALAAAHQAFVVHRDLKPSNVLIRRDGVVKLIDFGLAKAVDEAKLRGAALTTSHARVGTVPYMSPEQVTGDFIAVTSDVYSAGILAFEVLTGQLPYESKVTLFNAETVITQSPIRRMRSIVPTPAPLQWVIERALERKRADRYQSANAFADDLRRWLAGEAVLAGDHPWHYRAGKWARRHQNSLVTAGLLVITCVVALLGTVKYIVDLRAEQRQTATEAARARTAKTEAEHARDAARQEQLQAERARSHAREAFTQLSHATIAFPSLISQANAIQDRRGGPPLVDALVAAIDEQMKTFPMDPDIEGANRALAGEALRAIGRNEDALRQLDHAISLLSSSLGNSSTVTIAAEHSRLLCLLAAGRCAEVVELSRDLHERSLQISASAWPDMPIAILLIKADAQQRLERFDAALQTLEQLRKQVINELGADSDDSIIVGAQIGKVYLKMNRLQEAVTLLCASHDACQRRRGADSYITHATGVDYAEALMAAGNDARALPLLTAALPALSAQLGAAHPNCLRCAELLMQGLRAHAAGADSAEILCRLSEQANRSALSGSREAFRIHLLAAEACDAADRQQDAINASTLAMQLLSTAIENPKEQAGYWESHAALLRKAGRVAEAVPWRLRTLKIFREDGTALTRDHPLVADTIAMLHAAGMEKQAAELREGRIPTTGPTAP
jgi:eukaryotic-like serine/threonine-protein kinase